MQRNCSGVFQTQDIMTQVFSFLSVKQLAPLNRVSLAFNLFASCDSLWRCNLKRDFHLDAPKNVSVKKYYLSIKKQIAQEKEITIYYCMFRAFFILATGLSLQLPASEKLKSLFSQDQISSLLKNKTFCHAEKESTEVLDKYLELLDKHPAEFVATIKDIFSDQIDAGMVQTMKSITECDFLPFFADLPLKPSLNTCLTFIEKPPLYLLYHCNAILALKVAVLKHPEAINQLAQSLSDEVYKLFNVQFMQESVDKSNEISMRKDFINWLLDHGIDLDKEVLFHQDNLTTVRRAAHLCIAKLTFASYIIEIAKDELNLKKIQSGDIGFLMKLLDDAGIAKQNERFYNPQDFDTKELLECGITALNIPQEHRHLLEIDKEILAVLTKVINMPTVYSMNNTLGVKQTNS
jgi:cytochrome c553